MTKKEQELISILLRQQPPMSKFDTSNESEHLMTVEELAVGLNMPEGLKSKGTGKDEQAHSLPPYRRRRAFLVDEYPACPESWMRSSGRIKSYFVPIIEGAGMWLDFNHCLRDVLNEVAIVTSVQGVNAITGLPCKDAQLEQYRDKCPKHKTEFGPDRFCKKCDFKWSKQNYLASTGTPHGSLWLDGFRAQDGVIRQYLFTKQEMRGVAAKLIGKDRVFALGISFFLSKSTRPKPVAPTRPFAYMSADYGMKGLDVKDGELYDNDTVSYSMSLSDGPIGACSTSDMTSLKATNRSVKFGFGGVSAPKATTGKLMAASNISTPATKIYAVREATGAGILDCKRALNETKGSVNHATRLLATKGTATASLAPKKVNVATMEVAAGAKINQRICDDPHDLEFWRQEPEGLIIVNYATEQECLEIISAGKVDLSGSDEGFLQNIPVGNA